MVSIDTNHNKRKIAILGKWMPPHIGHEAFIIKYAKEYGKILIIIGSCYSNGYNHNYISAVEREKMIIAILKYAKIPEENYEIVHVPDAECFEEWALDIKEVCNKYGVTHFCTGNREDILDVLEKRGETLGFEMINPEETSDIKIHATDIRKLILEGKYEDLKNLIPEAVKPILFKYSFKEILEASRNRGFYFIKGRQSVDMILLVRNISDGKIYVLLGKRSMEKEDFPGYLALPGGGIDKFESPIHAAIREFYEETGLKIKMLDNSLEPAIVRIDNVPDSKIEQMAFVGIYSSEDEKLSGSKGGSSQCFGIFIEDDISKLEEYLSPKDDLTDVAFYEIEEAVNMGLAYQHGTMLRKAIQMFNAYPDLRRTINLEEMNRSIETVVISFVGSSGAGKSTAALGTMFQLKKSGICAEYVPEFPKKLYYNGLLEKYIPNQSYIIAKQYKAIYDLLGQVNYIVTDAGMEISALHAASESKVVEDLAWYLKNKVKTITIFIERDESSVKYDPRGRRESEAESRVFGMKLDEYMKANNSEYIKVIGSDEAIKVAMDIIAKMESENQN